MFYTTIGKVRGCCGHRHRSIKTATKCLVKDQKACKSQGRYTSYSDRVVAKINRDVDMTTLASYQVEKLSESEYYEHLDCYDDILGR